MQKFRAIFVVVVLLLGSSSYQHVWSESVGTIPEPGPINDNLRLRLSIPYSPDGDIKNHEIQLEIMNVGRKPIVLIDPWKEGSFNYLIYPEIAFQHGPQTMSPINFDPSSKPEPEPEVEASPMKSITHKAFVSDGVLAAGNGSFIFPKDGLYQIHVELRARKKDGSVVLLRSNEQPLVINGSFQMPKHTVANVIKVDEAKNTVMLDVGGLHQIEENDVFRFGQGMMGMTVLGNLKVTKVRSTNCEAEIEVVSNRSNMDVAEFLKKRRVKLIDEKLVE